MKKVFLLVLTVFVVLGFSACDDEGGSGDSYYIKFVHDGTKYNLTQGDNDIADPYISIYSGINMDSEPYDELFIVGSNDDDTSEVSIQVTVGIYDAFKDSGNMDEAFVKVPTGEGSWDNINITSYDITDLAITEDDAGEMSGVALGTFSADGVTEAAFRVKVVDISEDPVK